MISREAAGRIRALLAELQAVVNEEEAKAFAAPPAEPRSPPAAPAGPRMTQSFFVDYGKFYDFLRDGKLLGPVITESEFKGCDAIIHAFATAGACVSYCAYGLATAYLETANTMQPIGEYGGTAYFTRMYDIKGARPTKARELGNLTPGDGARYHGRGYVQLTGKTNYARASKRLAALGIAVDLVANPDEAKRPDVAAVVMVAGMTEGWFTGRKLADDLPEVGIASYEQFRASRDIINGRDRQDEIARFAIDFQTGLMLAGYRV